MHCPFCQHEDTRVIDSRVSEDGATIRRRRECEQCGERFNTFETAEIKLPNVVKGDNRREPFDEGKLRTGFMRALQKRPVGSDQVDASVRVVVEELRRSGEREVPSLRIGELVMRELKKLDHVAYVRFASVYRSFEDVQAFREEIERLERDIPSMEGLQLPLLGDDIRRKPGKGAESGIEAASTRPKASPATPENESAYLSARDHEWMARALRLAERGLFTTQPNPRVGCVIAQGTEIVGEGWHRRAGEPHAEVLALREAADRTRGATAYVTLEPCGLHGRTPPCADALIAAGIARVVIASEDADQRAGGAFDRLRGAGIRIETGLLRDAARELNRGFFSRVERGRPWLRVKLAMSLDGRTALANGQSKWITGEAARADVQRWRARSSAILTGIGTVLADDPALTVRGKWGQSHFSDVSPDVQSLSPKNDSDPISDNVRSVRVVLDRELRMPRDARILDGSAPTLVLHARAAMPVDERFANVEQVAVESDERGLDLDAVLRVLAARGMNEVQVEAGPTLCGSLFAAGLVDELLLYVAPLLLGDVARPLLALPTLSDMASRWQLRVVDQRQVGDDVRLLLRAR